MPTLIPLQLTGEILDLVLTNRLILYGSILLLIAIGLEVINGLIDIAVYTALIGGLILSGYGLFIYIT